MFTSGTILQVSLLEFDYYKNGGKRVKSCNIPEVSRLILVASGTISRDGEGRSLAKDDLSPEISVYC